MERTIPRNLSAGDAAGWALSHGVSALTTAELADLLGVPRDQVRQRVNPMVRKRQWVMPVRGLWVPVHPEYQTWGAPPGIEIIDQMMGHLQMPYYVGWLSAATLRGVTHHAPQEFQVAVTRSLRSRTVGRTRFVFAQRKVVQELTETHQTNSGAAVVSTLACTFLDIANDVELAGGINNAATVLVELAELDAFSIQAVADLAPHFPASALRRAGWILEAFGRRSDVGALRRVALLGAHKPSRLVPSGEPAGPVDAAWALYINGTVEPDL